MLFISLLNGAAHARAKHPAGGTTRPLWFIFHLYQAFFPPATRAGSLFPARGHSLAEHLSEQGVGTPLRRSEHMQISQRDAQPEVLMNL